ncbi:GntR family transcriptional regulator [Pseudonocardia sp. UM4_GMWB1]|uniref:GntR family transcriptional regulator n=1 Tax=unclassified Pseudonocardia TaxID=2619320 RepID=UPI000924841D|nr:GntR family transcriptional regulator [Pseudonocardia sp. SID8383]MYW71683.1 FCD domain-containing protein [Pseudonocardia sp. SID8383]OJG07880.1 HTH-type transcriptional regulator McbR [Pseudonocardia autotrophica]
MSEMDAPPKSRTAYVLDRLKADLQHGVINPGDQLRQTAIAKRYGVSPTPVREALRILAADGTIEYTSHRGATVRDFTPEMAQDLYRMRAELEGLACEVAVERMTDEGYAAIVAANERLVRATADGAEPATLSLLNKDLHFAIYETASSVMVEGIALLWARFKPSVTLWGVGEFSRALDQDHDAILEALGRRDGPAARAAMHAHVMHAWELRQTSEELRATGRVGGDAPGSAAS